MKRVKIMLTAILVMGVVAAGLAFKVVPDEVCAYSGTAAANCPRVSANCVESITTAGSSTQFAKTLECPTTTCPLTTECVQSRTLIGD